MTIAHILKKPIITEKSLQRVAQAKYTFEISLSANKAQVAEAVGKLFSVDVLGVKVIVRKGKEKRVPRRRQTVTTSKRKYAIVSINPKQSITLFSEFTPSEEEAK